MATALATPAAVTPSGFFWGENGAMLTPAQIAARQQIAEAMLARGGTPQNVGQGLTAVGQALLASRMMGTANQAEQQGVQSASAAMDAAMQDPSQILKAVENPFLNAGQQTVAEALLQRQNPMFQAQLQAEQADAALKLAQAEALQGGGPTTTTVTDPTTGLPYGVPQYGSTLRPLAVPGSAAPAAPAPPGSPAASIPAVSAPASAGAAAGQPVPLAPLPAADGAGSPAPAPFSMSPAAAAGAKAAATVEGTYQGNLPQNQLKAAQALEEQDIVNQTLLGAPDPKSGQPTGGLIDQAIEAAKNPLATGILGQISRHISGSPAADLDALLENIHANAAQKAIADFRDSAPAGSGSTMRITQTEALLFGKTLANISADQDSKQLVQQLQALKGQLSDITGAMKDSYARTFGSLPKVKTARPGAFPAGAAALPDGTTKTLNGVTYTFANGQWTAP